MKTSSFNRGLQTFYIHCTSGQFEMVKFCYMWAHHLQVGGLGSGAMQCPVLEALVPIVTGTGNVKCHFTEFLCEMEKYKLDIDCLTSIHSNGSGTKLLDWGMSLSPPEFRQAIPQAYMVLTNPRLMVSGQDGCLYFKTQEGQFLLLFV